MLSGSVAVPDLRTRLAEAICTLNTWATPDELKEEFGRQLTREEVKTAIATLQAFIPYDEWLPVWRAQRGFSPDGLIQKKPTLEESPGDQL
jgi:hypothetical protein